MRGRKISFWIVVLALVFASVSMPQVCLADDDCCCSEVDENGDCPE